MRELIYASERKVSLGEKVMLIAFFLLLSLCAIFGFYHEFHNLMIVIVIVVLFISYTIFFLRRIKMSYNNAMSFREGMMLNGTKVQGVAKKRASALLVTYTDPITKKEKSYVTPIMYTKPERNVLWSCDVYVTENEVYSTNFRVITTSEENK